MSNMEKVRRCKFCGKLLIDEKMPLCRRCVLEGRNKSVQVAGIVFGATTTVLSGGATVLICLTELWSVLENLNTVNPNGPWRILKSFLKDKSKKYTGVELKLDKDGKVNDVKPVSAEVAEES